MSITPRNPEMSNVLILGLDIGGTKSTVILATTEGDILGRISAPTEVSEGAKATINRLVTDANVLLSKHLTASDKLLGVGISGGGPLDPIEGVIYSPPNLPGWDRVPIVKLVQDQLNLPVVLENDADACALAELFFGAGQGKKNIVSFTWGTGIGAGIIINGRLYSGSFGLAGEMGHITYVPGGRLCECGKVGCIEAYASGSSIARIANEMVNLGRETILSNLKQVDTEAVCEAARHGDQLALDVLAGSSRAMAHAVSIAAHTLNPEVITLGTLAVLAGDMLMPKLMEVVAEEVWDRIAAGLQVMPSPLGSKVQDLAAISAFIGRQSS
jgi:glucokinase